VIPENIHTPTTDEIGNSLGVLCEVSSVVGVWLFSGTTQCILQVTGYNDIFTSIIIIFIYCGIMKFKIPTHPLLKCSQIIDVRESSITQDFLSLATCKFV